MIITNKNSTVVWFINEREMSYYMWAKILDFLFKKITKNSKTINQFKDSIKTTMQKKYSVYNC